jgi:hypothetical protein
MDNKESLNMAKLKELENMHYLRGLYIQEIIASDMKKSAKTEIEKEYYEKEIQNVRDKIKTLEEYSYEKELEEFK